MYDSVKQYGGGDNGASGATPQHSQALTFGKPARVNAPGAIDGPVITLLDAVMRQQGVVALRWTPEGGGLTAVRATITQFRGDVEVARDVPVPPWGVVLPLATGLVRVTARADAGTPAGLVIAGLGYGRGVSEWALDEPERVMPPAGTETTEPPPWARRIAISVLTGSLVDPVIPAGGSLTLVALPRTLTAGGGGATVSWVWEVFS